MTSKPIRSAFIRQSELQRGKSQASRCAVPIVLLTVLVALMTSACASRTTPPRFPGAITPPPKARSASEAGARLAETALRLQGTPYRNGGSDLSGFDCSGLVQYVFARHGVALPRSVREQFQAGLAVPRAALVPGDLVFFATTAGTPSHVGIIVGDDSFVHAPSGRGTVRVDHLSAEYWTRHYVGARRILLP
jgi:cell wall-associated NlpC family hydrolase